MTVIDAWGKPVPSSQKMFVRMVQPVGFGQTNYDWEPNPDYKPPDNTSNGQGNTGSAAPAPPNFQFTFDTIGQVIYRSIGHVRLPLKLIWAQGINASGDITQATTLSFAAALGAPIDPNELGNLVSIFDGGNQVFGDGSVIPPDTWSSVDQAQLIVSLAGATLYVGNEAQQPAPLIVSDKGASVTNAFRGIRYIVFPDYPITRGMPNLSIVFERSNPGGTPRKEKKRSTPTGAVEFAPGSG